jgi:hypothetical protein
MFGIVIATTSRFFGKGKGKSLPDITSAFSSIAMHPFLPVSRDSDFFSPGKVCGDHLK